MIPTTILRTRLFIVAFALVELLAIATTCTAQTPPDDSGKYHLVVVTSEPNTAADAELLTSLRSHPTLARIAAQCKCFHFTPTNTLYRARYASALPAVQLPIVALVRSDGGVLYKASGGNIPPPDDLAEQIIEMGKADRQANPRPVVPASDYLDCPDGNCPLQPQVPRQPLRPILPLDGSRLPQVIPDTVTVQPTVHAEVPDSVGYALGGLAILGLLILAIVCLAGLGIGVYLIVQMSRKSPYYY